MVVVAVMVGGWIGWVHSGSGGGSGGVYLGDAASPLLRNPPGQCDGGQPPNRRTVAMSMRKVV